MFANTVTPVMVKNVPLLTLAQNVTKMLIVWIKIKRVRKKCVFAKMDGLAMERKGSNFFLLL